MMQLTSVVVMGQLRRCCFKKRQRMVSAAGPPEIDVEPIFGVRCTFKIQSKTTVCVSE